MKFKFILVCVLATTTFFNTTAQEKKYQSLLWKISGNGLEKPSYMYGTMHVSDKLSYHLSDNFFNALTNADIVANESDPATWNDNGALYSNQQYYGGRVRTFYDEFYLEKLKKDDLYKLMRGKNYNLNGLLSRTNDGASDYQEETYLDMFIYRAGNKLGKRFEGLEDSKEAMLSIMKGQMLSEDEDISENYQLIQRIIKDKNYNEAIQDFYREKDLDMLDTLMKLSMPPSYFKGMLINRNVTMVNSMIDLMKQGSLFAAVGASHLPGQEGMIEMLRAKGYTVEPVFGEYTETGKSKKKEIEESFIKPTFKKVTTSDGLITLPLYDLVTYYYSSLQSADLTNGGYINVKRELVNDFVRTDKTKFNHLTLDSLFFENIPGDVLEKNFYEENNYLVYDIKSITKTKKTQHYRYYITPLEVIAVIMGGEGDYVRKYEDLVFDHIEIQPYTGSWDNYSPVSGGFEVTIPSYYASRGNLPLDEVFYDSEIYGFQEEDSSYYFLLERRISNNENLVPSEFELGRLQYEFCFQLKSDTTDTSFDKKNLRFYSSSKAGENEVRLMSTMKGNRYYLLGTVRASKENASKFFDSFKWKELKGKVEMKEYMDTSYAYKVNLPKEPNDFLDFVLRDKDPKWDENKKTNYFTGEFRRFEFKSADGERISFAYKRYHKYEYFDNKEEFWKDIKKSIVKDWGDDYYDWQSYGNNSEKNKSSFSRSKWKEVYKDKYEEEEFSILEDKMEERPDGTTIYHAVVGTKNSKQVIRYAFAMKHNRFYEFYAVLEKDKAMTNEFFNETINSFEILDSDKDQDVFTNKVELFMIDAKNEADSIRYSALNTFQYMELSKDDLVTLKPMIENFEFRDDESSEKANFYQELAITDFEFTLPYLKAMYKDENVTSQEQISIIEVLGRQDRKDAYELIMELMEYDLPLVDNSYSISRMFDPMEERVEFASVLFPDIFQFFTVDEYNKPIMNLTKLVLEDNAKNVKKLKSYKKLLLTNAKLEAKRLKSWKQEQDNKSNSYGYYGSSNPPISDLKKYLTVLAYFEKDKDVQSFITQLHKMDIRELKVELIGLEIDHQKPVDNNTIDELLSNPESAFSAYQILQHTGNKTKLANYEDDSIAYAAMRNLYNLKVDEDSVVFIEKKVMDHKGQRVAFYFYKTIDIDEDSRKKGEERIAGVAFIQEEGRINPQLFRTLKRVEYIDEEDKEDYMASFIDEVMFDSYPRVNHDRISQANNSYSNFFGY